MTSAGLRVGSLSCFTPRMILRLRSSLLSKKLALKNLKPIFFKSFLPN
jgi:hypothetical protein